MFLGKRAIKNFSGKSIAITRPEEQKKMNLLKTKLVGTLLALKMGRNIDDCIGKERSILWARALMK